MGLQQSLAENAEILCPIAVSSKDFVDIQSKIEEMLKGQSGDAGKSPAEYLEEWLNGSEAPLRGLPEIKQ